MPPPEVRRTTAPGDPTWREFVARTAAPARAASLERIHREWQAFTERHRTGHAWGTFRALVSVLQVAASFVVVFGTIVLFPPILSWLPPEHLLRRLMPVPAELMVLGLMAAPEWVEVLLFGVADRTLRAAGVLKRVATDDAPPERPRSDEVLAMLGYAQGLSRLTNLAVHLLAAMLACGVLAYAARTLSL